MQGTSTNNAGVYGESSSTFGVYGSSSAPATSNGLTSVGVRGIGNDAGVYGNTNTTGTGVVGHSDTHAGVVGQSLSAAGVQGTGHPGIIATGRTSSGAGAIGVHGVTSSASEPAILDEHNGLGAGYGVQGTASGDGGIGVYGLVTNTNAYAVYGRAQGSGSYVLFAYTDDTNIYGAVGVVSQPGSYAIYGDGHAYPQTMYAGYFNGTVAVNGNLSKAGKLPYLSSPGPGAQTTLPFLCQSPDMKNVYDGVTTLDENGEALITLPEWFEALNSDFRYLVTCIGGADPVYIAEEINDNQFKIAGGRVCMRVTWQVTGIRQDPWAQANRIPVEELKLEHEQGLYYHPELYGQPGEKSLHSHYQQNVPILM